jgi:hypothetical protein
LSTDLLSFWAFSAPLGPLLGSSRLGLGLVCLPAHLFSAGLAHLGLEAGPFSARGSAPFGPPACLHPGLGCFFPPPSPTYGWATYLVKVLGPFGPSPGCLRLAGPFCLGSPAPFLLSRGLPGHPWACQPWLTWGPGPSPPFLPALPALPAQLGAPLAPFFGLDGPFFLGE